MTLTPTRADGSDDSDVRRFIWLGGLTVFLLVASIGLWSVVAPIEGAVIAPATLQVKSNRKIVQHLEGGIVHEIFVGEGDAVEVGALIVKLDDTAARASLDANDARLIELMALYLRLVSERDDQLTIPASVELSGLGQAARVADVVEGQRLLFVARRESRESEAALLGQRILQLEERIGGLEILRTSKSRQLGLIEEELEGVSLLHAQGHAPRTRVLALRREVERLRGEQGSHAADIAETRSAIGEAEMEISRLAAGYREEVLAQLRDVEAELVQQRQQRIIAADVLSRTEVRAPRSGRVLGLRLHTVGGVVSPGDTVMYIVPDGDPLIVAARLRPQDVDNVAIGDVVRLRFSAFSQRTTPELEGVVTQVSADALVDEATGASFYTAIVELDDLEPLRRLELTLVPGMPVEAFIRTGSRPAISYLIKPLTDALAHSFREE